MIKKTYKTESGFKLERYIPENRGLIRQSIVVLWFVLVVWLSVWGVAIYFDMGV